MPRTRIVMSAIAGLLFGASAVLGQTFTNSAAITIPGNGPATPYPSVIIVSGGPASINYTTVRLNGLAHTFPNDIQVVLVAPTGQRALLMAGSGGGFPISGVDVTFAQDAPNFIPGNSQIFPGVYRPRSVSVANLPAPCPAGPYPPDLFTFNGLNANGTWSLFVFDAATGDSGSIAAGWSITFNQPERPPGAIGTAFSYQGRLTGIAPNVGVSLRFSLWDNPDSQSTVNRVGAPITRNVVLADNVFSTLLDFGVNIQRQTALYLQVEASAVGPSGPFTTLNPRQPLTGAPLALELKGVTVDINNQVGVGGIDDPQFIFETNGRMRVRGDASVGTSINPTSPGLWLSSPNTAGAQINRGFFGARDDNNVGIFAGSGPTFPFLVNANNNINIGDTAATAPPEKLTVTGNIQLNTPGRLSFGPVADFSGNAENTDALFLQRDNTSINVSVLRLNLGDDPTGGGADSFIISTTNNGTAFTERFRFMADGNAFKPGGGAWSALSDASAKDNITPLVGTLDRLLNLRGYSFTYKPQFIADGRALPGTQIGLIAQDVQNVFPDWVATSPDGKLFVTERATTALMVEALRDLRAEKDAQLRALREENIQLRRRLDALERAIVNPPNTGALTPPNDSRPSASR